MNRIPEIRTYLREECVVFCKTTEAYGGLSNMAAGFPIRVNGVRIRTSEALYQACRFPHLPDVQRLIIDEASPMTAKMKSKPYRKDSRPDWEQVRVKIMRWCLRVKLAQNWSAFSLLLLTTGDRAIVEESRKDDFWGAKVVNAHTLRGMNVLGRLLMELREEIKQRKREQFQRVEPLSLAEFLLLDKSITAVDGFLVQGQHAARSLPSREPTATQFENQMEAPAVALGVKNPSAIDGGVARAGGQLTPLSEGLKPYLQYKESGHPWFGAVPEHWSVLPNRAIFAEVKDRHHPDEEMLSVTITQGIVRQRVLLVSSAKKDSSNQDKSAYKLVQPCDLAYNKMRAWQGAIGVSDLRGIVSPAYVVMRLRDENENEPRYFHYLFRTPGFAKEAERWSYGITSDMWSLRPEHFRLIYSPLPLRSEQRAIVRFVDYLSARVNHFVQAKRKVIALLNEQKQAIIYGVVTGGLNHEVALRPAGVSWLTKIPQHWETRRNSRIFRERIEKGRAGLPLLVVSLRSGVTVGGDVDESGRPKRLIANMQSYKLAKQGDLAYNMMRMWQGAVGKVPIDGLVSPAYVVAQPLKDIEPDYFSLLFRTQEYKNEVNRNSRGIVSDRNRLYWDDFKSLISLVPPNSEQIEISGYVARATRDLDCAISRTEREIELIREYRTRLISDVVTGKLDVREASQRLPAETPDVEIKNLEEDLIEETEAIEDEQIA